MIRHLCPGAHRPRVLLETLSSVEASIPTSFAELRFISYRLELLYNFPRVKTKNASFARPFHATSFVSRRAPRPLPVYRKKEVAEVWRGMTMKDLARSIDREPEDLAREWENVIAECSPDRRIYDPNLLHQVVKSSPFRCRLVQRHDVPKESPTSTASVDAVPRPKPSAAEYAQFPLRQPVVTIMGHVDHGKTTLLDRLRKTNVVDGEFGGITQHIGAFSVRLEGGNEITFLDTPGHAAFSSMRGRGANVTDVVILVVAAEDGVMTQTIESVEHAQAAGVPIVVAINKIDHPSADVQGTKRELLELGLELEEFGGDVLCVPISAYLGKNLDTLMEAVLTQAELLDLRADPDGLVEGTVIETRQVDGLGKLVTTLIQRGTLKKGALLVAGEADCRVRNLYDHAGRPLAKAPPAVPVEIAGWKSLPKPGDKLLQVENDRRLKRVMAFRAAETKRRLFLEAQTIVERQKKEDEAAHKEKWEARRAQGRYRLKIKDFRREKEAKRLEHGFPTLNVIIRCDVDGSLEAILGVIDTYQDEKCHLDIVYFGVGAPTPSDVELADTFRCVIYSFNLKTPKSVETLAKSSGVSLRSFNIIYRLFEDVKTELTSRLPPLNVEEVLGEADVLQPFVITDDKKKKRPVAGSKCFKGSLVRDKRFKLTRNGVVVHDGHLFSLRHFKDEVKAIPGGMECGVAFDDAEVLAEPGDLIVCYEIRERKQVIDWDFDF